MAALYAARRELGTYDAVLWPTRTHQKWSMEASIPGSAENTIIALDAPCGEWIVMNGSGTLFQEYSAQIKEVRDYLTGALPHAELEESENFDRDGIQFRLAPLRLIFVSHEFLSDSTTQDAASRLRSWRVADEAKKLPVGSMLLVTTEGTIVEKIRTNRLTT